MKAYEASATIAADPETIWAILTDAADYPGWDSGVERIEGRIAPNETIKVFTDLSPGRAFPAKVTVFEPGRRMVWAGGMPLGLFTGVRTFTLTPQGDGTTEFRTREEFSGPLLPLIGRRMPDLQPSFDRFAAGLKRRAEGGG